MNHMLDREKLKAEQRLDIAIRRMLDHILRPKLNYMQRQHASKWAAEAAHAVFELHPELREDGSLLRYFVAKAARKTGHRGAKVTQFVDAAYADGSWHSHIPEAVLLEHIKPAGREKN